MKEHRRLLRLSAGIRPQLTVSVAIALLVSVTFIVQAVLTSAVFRDVLEGADLGDATPMILAVGAVVLGRAALLWAAEVAAQWTAGVVKERVRRSLFRKLFDLGPGHVSRGRTGELQSLLVDGVEALETYYAGFLPSLVVAFFVPAAIVLFMATRDLALALVLAAFAVITPLAPRVWNRMLARTNAARAQAWRALGADYLDSMQGLPTLKAFGASGRRRQHLATAADRFVRTTMRTLRLALLHYGFLSLGMLGGIAVLTAVGVVRVAGGSLDVMTLFLATFLTREAFRPFADLAGQFHASHAARVVGQELDRLLHTPPPAPAPADARPAAVVTPAVVFDNVTFRYDERRPPALQRLSFTVNEGETVAIVGRSGAGKTTVCSLLLRFFDPDEGRILLGDRDIRTLPLQDLRQAVAVVSQDTYLFVGSIADNIRLGRPDATDDEVEAAAKAANAHGFISSLPDGYRTAVGERGLRLSGGQRQRIAIARALLKDASVLVLDEATASVDAAAEAAIQEALDRVTADRTTIVIAHRLSTVRNADRIVVLADGDIVEVGPHAELVSRGGEYARLVGAQASA